MCTANDVSKLPPEFSRAERFDGIFFLDLPGRAQKDVIWRQYIAEFELDALQRVPDDLKWTGAEIKSCCRLAALLDVPLTQAAKNIVPVAVTSAESVERFLATGPVAAVCPPKRQGFMCGPRWAKGTAPPGRRDRSAAQLTFTIYY